MRRFLIISLSLLFVLPIIAAGIFLYLANNEDFLKTQAGKYAFKYTGRQLVIDGPLGLSLGRETALEAAGIRLSNAAWAKSPDMIRVGNLRVSLDVPSLFDKVPHIVEIELEDCSIELSRNTSGEANWDVLPEKNGASRPQPDNDEGNLIPITLGHLNIRNCSLLRDSSEQEQALEVRIDFADLQQQAAENRIVAKAQGSIDGDALNLDGWIAPATVLQSGGHMDHEIRFHAGEVTLVSSGTLGDFTTLADPNLSGHFTGPEIGDILSRYALPPISEGAFDFRLDLSTHNDLTVLDLDGDLGSLEILANGKLDKLIRPRQGDVWAQISGPDLHALGQAMGLEGLVQEPYEFMADIDLESGQAQIHEAHLNIGSDRLEVQGAVTLSDRLPNSRLTLNLASGDLGRWAGLVGQPVQDIGAVALEGLLTTDENGTLNIDSEVEHDGSHLTVSGKLGPLTGPYEVDLDVDFSADHPITLLKIYTHRDFPDLPIRISGNFASSPEELRFTQVSVLLDQYNLRMNGHLNLAEQFAGSEFDLEVDIPDLFSFGQLWDAPNFPHEALHARGRIRPQGNGLAFNLDDGNMGEVRLKVDGLIADLDNPLGIDATFDINLPGAGMVGWLLPEIELPHGPIRASGSLENQKDQTRLKAIRLHIGEVSAGVDGVVMADSSYQLSVEISGPNGSKLSPLTLIDMPAKSFSGSALLAGNPTSLTIDQARAVVGESNATGRIEFKFGDPLRISGDIHSPHLDLTGFIEEKTSEESAPKDPNRKYVFDDSGLFDLTPYGLVVEAELKIDKLLMHGNQLSEIDLGLVMEDEYLSISPFTFRGSANGLFEGNVTMDGRQGATELVLDVVGKNQVMAPWPAEGQDPSTLPRGEFSATLRGQGNTEREMVSSLDGKIRIEVGEGQLAPTAFDFLLNDFMMELTSALDPTAEQQKYTHLECAVAAADIESGLVNLKPLVVNAQKVTIISSGTLDLKTEKLDFSFNSKQKKGLGISASDLVNPFIKVGGRLVAPMIELDPAGTVVKGGLAVATVGLSIVAKSMSDRFLSSKDPCGDALRDIAKRDSVRP